MSVLVVSEKDRRPTEDSEHRKVLLLTFSTVLSPLSENHSRSLEGRECTFLLYSVTKGGTEDSTRSSTGSVLSTWKGYRPRLYCPLRVFDLRTPTVTLSDV